jgi:hypothetical protein
LLSKFPPLAAHHAGNEEAGNTRYSFDGVAAMQLMNLALPVFRSIKALRDSVELVSYSPHPLVVHGVLVPHWRSQVHLREWDAWRDAPDMEWIPISTSHSTIKTRRY